MKKTLIALLTLCFCASIFAASPPGLSKKGSMPRGLEGKTPHGWSQGQKRGWDKVWNNKTKEWNWVKKSKKKGKRRNKN